MSRLESAPPGLKEHSKDVTAWDRLRAKRHEIKSLGLRNICLCTLEMSHQEERDKYPRKSGNRESFIRGTDNAH